VEGFFKLFLLPCHHIRFSFYKKNQQKNPTERKEQNLLQANVMELKVSNLK